MTANQDSEKADCSFTLLPDSSFLLGLLSNVGSFARSYALSSLLIAIEIKAGILTITLATWPRQAKLVTRLPFLELALSADVSMSNVMAGLLSVVFVNAWMSIANMLNLVEVLRVPVDEQETRLPIVYQTRSQQTIRTQAITFPGQISTHQIPSQNNRDHLLRNLHQVVQKRHSQALQLPPV